MAMLDITHGQKRKRRVGENLRRARLARGLTQDGLAERMTNVEQGTISRWENGVISPSPEHQAELAEILEVSYTDTNNYFESGVGL